MALAINLLIAAAKATAALITGSSALLAEAAHMVAVRLASRERELLTNQSAPPAVVAAIRRTLESAPGVRTVPRLEVLVIGPRTLLVTAEVGVGEPAGGEGGGTGDAEEGVTELLARLRDQLRSDPGVAEVYLTPVTSAGP